jgi:hypothetical protein
MLFWIRLGERRPCRVPLQPLLQRSQSPRVGRMDAGSAACGDGLRCLETGKSCNVCQSTVRDRRELTFAAWPCLVVRSRRARLRFDTFYARRRKAKDSSSKGVPTNSTEAGSGTAAGLARLKAAISRLSAVPVTVGVNSSACV